MNKLKLANAPPLVTIAEAATLLRVSRRTIHRLLARRQLLARRISNGRGARVLLATTDIEALLEADHAK